MFFDFVMFWLCSGYIFLWFWRVFWSFGLFMFWVWIVFLGWFSSLRGGDRGVFLSLFFWFVLLFLVCLWSCWILLGGLFRCVGGWDWCCELLWFVWEVCFWRSWNCSILFCVFYIVGLLRGCVLVVCYWMLLWCFCCYENWCVCLWFIRLWL